MTPLLEQALTEVKKLPEPEQDAIASLILDELSDERRWQESFARSQEPLARLAAKAREDIRAGRIKSGGLAKREKDRIDLLFEEGTQIDEALRRAVRDALRRHKQAKNPIAVWQDGKVVWIAPEDIPVDDE